jgi:peptidoglycan hydrolase-like protein with peptidoglycan-binding domain
MRVVPSVLATALALALAPAAFAGNEAPFVDTNTLRQVQQTLRSRGFDPGVVDGRMGRATQEAIRAFQRAESLEATGQLNSRTLTALGLADDSAAAPRGADDPKVVRRVQQTLNNRGFDAGSVNGVLGPSTRAALKRFQQGENLEASGELNPQTLTALGIPEEKERASTGEASAKISAAADLRDVQRVLRDRGYYKGPIDGVMGPETRSALTALQRAENLEPTGALNSRTLAVLGISRE